MGHTKVKNPISVLSQKVDFRNAKGRYAKPEKASSFFVEIEGLRLKFDIPKKIGRKRENIFLFVSEIVHELKLQLIPSEVARIEQRREEIPETSITRPISQIAYKVETSEHTYFSRQDKVNYHLKAFYFWFEPPYEINLTNTRKVMAQIYRFAYRRAVETIRKHRLKGHRYLLKIVGGGRYSRILPGKIVEDTFGYSGMRKSVPQNRHQLKQDIKYDYADFMRDVLNPIGKMPNYFRRLSMDYVEENDRKYSFYVHGIKLEFVKVVES